jgi:CubicO group peptidase (beta-lactamase class C family)
VLAWITFASAQMSERSTISRALQPFVDRHELAGAVTLVASKDKVISLEAIGYADIAANKAMTTDALFWIASMSKPITVTAFMMLVDEGTVRLDDPVEKYLPHWNPRIMVASANAKQVVLQNPQHAITVRPDPEPSKRTSVPIFTGNSHA